MTESNTLGSFHLYIWRSADSPGAVYLAQGFEAAEALCRGLSEDGYIVKVVHTATNTEFKLLQGELCPSPGFPRFSEMGTGAARHQGRPQAFA